MPTQDVSQERVAAVNKTTPLMTNIGRKVGKSHSG
jgi:hypothetical protein